MWLLLPLLLPDTHRLDFEKYGNECTLFDRMAGDGGIAKSCIFCPIFLPPSGEVTDATHCCVSPIALPNKFILSRRRSISLTGTYLFPSLFAPWLIMPCHVPLFQTVLVRDPPPRPLRRALLTMPMTTSPCPSLTRSSRGTKNAVSVSDAPLNNSITFVSLAGNYLVRN